MKIVFLILMASLFFGCIPKESSIAINFKKTSKSFNASVSSVQIINHQLVITGQGLDDVTDVKVDGNSLNENFTIESKTGTQIFANSNRAFSFDTSKIFNLIISDANASATFQIDFSLCHSTLNGKGFDCTAPVSDKDVLSYDAVSGKWKPRAASGVNYIGTFNASTNPGTGPAILPTGSYYIISQSGSIAAVPFNAGDWLISNGTTWQKIDNSTGVLSVFGRSGAITAQSGDYDLSMLGDVSFPTAPVAGKVLKFDGTHWVAGDDLSGGGGPTGPITTTDITDGAVTDAKITSVAASKLTGTITSAQITDGTIVNADINAAAAIAYSKLSIPDGSIPYAKLIVGNGDIPASAISGLPSATSILSTSITDGDTTHAPDSNVVFDTLATKLDKTGGTITTILNVPAPVLNTEATTKLYVDTADNLKANKAGDTFSGVLSLDNDLRIKGGSNYVTVKGNAASAAYTLTLPANAGTANQVLTTNGSGVLTWTTPSGSVTSLDAINVSTGVVSNAEFDYLDGVTSSIQAQLNAKEGSLPTGGTALQYFAGNKTLQTLNTAAVPESGSNYYFTDARTRAATLTGLSATAGTLTATDTVLGAFGKMLTTQGDYVSKSGNTTVLGQITIDATLGVLNVPTPASATQATPKAWVESLVDSYGHWAKSGSNISFSGGRVGIGTATPAQPLSVNGIIESTTGGVKFPDGTVQLTAGQWNSGGGSTLGTAFDADTFSPQGAQGTQLSVPTSGSVDDGFYTITLPFPVNFNGTMYSTVYVGTNSYVTFGGGSTAYNSLTASNPAYDKILVNSSDRSSNSVWFSSSPTAFMIRYEGGCSSSTPGANQVWELSGTSANDKKLTLNIVSVCTGNTYSAVATPALPLHTFIATAGTAYAIEYKSVASASSVNYMAGSVGIGTNTPTATLEVAGQVKITGGTPGAGKVLTSDSVGLASWQTVSAPGDNLGNHTATTNIRLGSNYLSGDGGNEGISVNSDGNVGIGTTSQVGALAVSGNAWGNYSRVDFTSFYPFNGMSQGTSFVEVANDNGGFSAPGSFVGFKTTSMSAPPQRAFIGIVAESGASNYTPNIVFGQQTGANSYEEKMRIDANGNLGIGTFAGVGDKIAVYNGSTTGTYTTSGWMHSSDRRLKHDISPIEDSLNKILKLNGVEYIFNSDPSNKRQLGLIAQDVEPIFPEVVSTDKKGFKSMVYSNLVAPLIESVKALYARIVGTEKHNEVQDRQIASLKLQNEKLIKENSEIKAYLCSKDPKATICK